MRAQVIADAVRVVEGVSEQLAGALGGRVGRDRLLDRIGLAERPALALAVDRRRRREHELRHVRAHGRLAHDRAVPCTFTSAYAAGRSRLGRTPASAARCTTRVDARAGERAARARRRRGCRPRRAGTRVARSADAQVRALRGFGIERVEAVEADDLAALGEQALDERRADEARGARHEHALGTAHRAPGPPTRRARDALLRLEVGLDHDAHQLDERSCAPPSRARSRALVGSASSVSTSAGPQQRRDRLRTKSAGSSPTCANGDLDELAHRVVLAGADHVVVGLVGCCSMRHIASTYSRA